MYPLTTGLLQQTILDHAMKERRGAALLESPSITVNFGEILTMTITG
jgi:hypothetical protein